MPSLTVERLVQLTGDTARGGYSGDGAERFTACGDDVNGVSQSRAIHSSEVLDRNADGGSPRDADVAGVSEQTSQPGRSPAGELLQAVTNTLFAATLAAAVENLQFLEIGRYFAQPPFQPRGKAKPVEVSQELLVLNAAGVEGRKKPGGLGVSFQSRRLSCRAVHDPGDILFACALDAIAPRRLDNIAWIVDKRVIPPTGFLVHVHD